MNFNLDQNDINWLSGRDLSHLGSFLNKMCVLESCVKVERKLGIKVGKNGEFSSIIARIRVITTFTITF